jgi:hypothetical protein
MNFLVGALAILSALVLSGAAISMFALHRTHAMLRDLRSLPAEAPAAPAEDYSRELREAVAALAAQVHELQRSPSSPGDPAFPRLGLNLNKRSQALRLHRCGESTEQIASSLQLPRQEVDLLLKVHRIVLSTV